MKIVGVSGRMRVGKNSLSEYISQYLEFIGQEVLLESFAGPIKDMLVAGRFTAEERIEDPVEKAKIRRLMQTLGTEWGRETISPTVWIEALEEREPFHHVKNGKNSFLLVTDVRFENEALFIKEQGGVVIKVVREVEDEYPEEEILNYFKDSEHESEKIELDADLTLRYESEEDIVTNRKLAIKFITDHFNLQGQNEEA